MLEAELGHKDLARQLFEQGAAADPTHGPLHSARAKFEERYGKNAERAREVLREAADQYPCATIFSAWGKLEERQGNMMLAAELYEKGAESVQGARAGGGGGTWSALHGPCQLRGVCPAPRVTRRCRRPSSAPHLFQVSHAHRARTLLAHATCPGTPLMHACHALQPPSPARHSYSITRHIHHSCS